MERICKGYPQNCTLGNCFFPPSPLALLSDWYSRSLASPVYVFMLLKGWWGSATEVAVHHCAVNSSSIGESNEIWGITLHYPTDRALFSWVSLFRVRFHICACDPTTRLPFTSLLPVRAQPWPQLSVSSGACFSLCSLPTDGPCLQHFSNLAWEDQAEVICLLVRWRDPCYSLKAHEIRDAVDVLMCSYHKP